MVVVGGGFAGLNLIQHLRDAQSTSSSLTGAIITFFNRCCIRWPLRRLRPPESQKLTTALHPPQRTQRDGQAR